MHLWSNWGKLGQTDGEQGVGGEWRIFASAVVGDVGRVYTWATVKWLGYRGSGVSWVVRTGFGGVLVGQCVPSFLSCGQWSRVGTAGE